jgi:hypothetical protein
MATELAHIHIGYMKSNSRSITYRRGEYSIDIFACSAC